MPRAVNKPGLPSNYPNINFDKVRGTLKSISDLKSQRVNGIDDGDTIIVRGYNSVGDGGDYMYRWDSSSTEDVDEPNIIKPTFSDFGGTGRWKKISSGRKFPDSISSLLSFGSDIFEDDETVNVLGYYSAGDGGGGTFYWDSNEDKANHDGIGIIDPSHTGTIGDSGWYSADQTGSGCWKRKQIKSLSPIMAGVKGTSGNNEDDGLEAMFQVAANNGYDIKFGRNGYTYLVSRQFTIPSFSDSVSIDLGNNEIKVSENLTIDQNGILEFTSTNGYVRFKGGVLNGNDNVCNILRLSSNAEKGGVRFHDCIIENLFKDGSDGAMRGVYITGEGGVCEVKNIIVDGVDSSSGVSATTGIHIGQSGASFNHIDIGNIVGIDFTEQGGGTNVDDSDLLKIEGWEESTDLTKQTHVHIRNISVSNASGLSIKRVIKLQRAQTYDINGVYLSLANCSGYTIVGVQDGVVGDINNISAYLDTVEIGALVRGGNLVSRSDSLSQFTSYTICGVSITMKGTCRIIHPVRISGDSTNKTRYHLICKNFNIINIGSYSASDAYAFVHTQDWKGGSIIDAKNIYHDGDLPYRAFFDSEDTTGVYIKAYLNNVIFGSEKPLNSMVRGNSRCIASQIINSNIHVDDVATSDDVRISFGKKPENRQGMYVYEAVYRNESSGDPDEIILSFPDLIDTSPIRTGFMIEVNIRRSKTTEVSEVNFYLLFDYSTPDWSIALLTESHNGATLLATPSVSYNDTTKQATITFGSNNSSTFNTNYITLKGGMYYEVEELFGLPTQ